jgi:nucleoside 2-deoxyribosyltransferase
MPKAISVYMAGPVVELYVCKQDYRLDSNVKTRHVHEERICPWREIAFPSKHGDQEPGKVFDVKPIALVEYDEPKPITLEYAGPTINSSGHGMPLGEHHAEDDLSRKLLVQRCLGQIANCDVVFAWIDRENTVGTIVEIVAACFHKKPVFIVFETAELREYFYFLAHIPNIKFIVDSLPDGWQLFLGWVDSYMRYKR